PLPYRPVLLDDTLVLHGHLPPAELNHPGTHGQVAIVQRSPAARRLLYAHVLTPSSAWTGDAGTARHRNAGAPPSGGKTGPDESATRCAGSDSPAHREIFLRR